MKWRDDKLANPPKCGGYKYPKECPHDGVPDSKNEDCQECYKDSWDAQAKAAHLAWGRPRRGESQ